MPWRSNKGNKMTASNLTREKTETLARACFNNMTSQIQEIARANGLVPQAAADTLTAASDAAQAATASHTYFARIVFGGFLVSRMEIVLCNSFGGQRKARVVSWGGGGISGGGVFAGSAIFNRPVESLIGVPAQFQYNFGGGAGEINVWRDGEFLGVIIIAGLGLTVGIGGSGGSWEADSGRCDFTDIPNPIP